MGWLRVRDKDSEEAVLEHLDDGGVPVSPPAVEHAYGASRTPGPFAMCYLSFDTPWMRVRMLGAEFVPPSAEDGRSFGEIASDIPEAWRVLACWPALWSLEAGVCQSNKAGDELDRSSVVSAAPSGADSIGVWLGLCRHLLGAYARLLAWPEGRHGDPDETHGKAHLLR